MHGLLKVWYVVQEIVWIASFSPAIARGSRSARRLGMQATSVQHDQMQITNNHFSSILAYLSIGQIRRRHIQTLSVSGILRSDCASKQEISRHGTGIRTAEEASLHHLLQPLPPVSTCLSRRPL